MKDPLKLEIYGVKAKVYRAGKWLIGEIPELHVHDQAKSPCELEHDLRGAVDATVIFFR